MKHKKTYRYLITLLAVFYIGYVWIHNGPRLLFSPEHYMDTIDRPTSHPIFYHDVPIAIPDQTGADNVREAGLHRGMAMWFPRRFALFPGRPVDIQRTLDVQACLFGETAGQAVPALKGTPLLTF